MLSKFELLMWNTLKKIKNDKFSKNIIDFPKISIIQKYYRFSKNIIDFIGEGIFSDMRKQMFRKNSLASLKLGRVLYQQNVCP